ncbi:MAG: altronate hydrolase [Spirosomataceae bacterium]|jgi:altronate hydrolase
MNNILQIDPKDNAIVALRDLPRNSKVIVNKTSVILREDIAAKHKFALYNLPLGSEVYMYGVLVGKTVANVPEGGLLTIFNLKHAVEDYSVKQTDTTWTPPNTDAWENRTFNGFHRTNGSVGTANYWLVIPLVFCENHNVDKLKSALISTLGYQTTDTYEAKAQQLLSLVQSGKTMEEVLSFKLPKSPKNTISNSKFPNVDGIKFLTHEGGCGGTRQDAQALCGLLAGYITHPNVAGVTVLSLGCQNAEARILQEEIHKRDSEFDRPVHILDQQTFGIEEDLIDEALKLTILGIVKANEDRRQPAPLNKLRIGLECGGSDGFSGISANPTLGYVSDIISALKGKTILSEFPELCGVEQELANRCVSIEKATRFQELMTTYNSRAAAVGSGFDMNPSPGNIKDGLITDAIKSAGAAKKGGSSPITDILDYPEAVKETGLSLLCTPGNDVESTTAMVGSGATIVLFTTGLGTPTGNPIVPVVKVATNTILSERMSDIIDFNAGTIIDGNEILKEAGDRLLNLIIDVASGDIKVKAVLNRQDDFIPWKRGVSL